MAVRVLVVEDDQLILQLLRRMLGTECTVSTATSIQEALEQLELMEFDAVVADLELGDLERDGQWLLDRVREKQPAAKRLLMSGHHEPLRRLAAEDSVVALPKPFTTQDLISAVAG